MLCIYIYVAQETKQIHKHESKVAAWNYLCSKQQNGKKIKSRMRKTEYEIKKVFTTE